ASKFLEQWQARIFQKLAITCYSLFKPAVIRILSSEITKRLKEVDELHFNFPDIKFWNSSKISRTREGIMNCEEFLIKPKFLAFKGIGLTLKHLQEWKLDFSNLNELKIKFCNIVSYKDISYIVKILAKKSKPNFFLEDSIES